MQFIDKEDDLTVGLLNIFEHRLEAVFKLTAILRSRQHGSKIERDDALVAQQFRDIAGDDAPCQTLDDGGLAYSGLTNQHGVVLGAARKHLDHAANLFIAADDRIQFPPSRKFRQVLGVTVQRLVFALRALIGHSLVAAHRGQSLQDRVPGGAHGGQQHLRRIFLELGQRQQQMLGRNVLVFKVLRLFRGVIQHPLHSRRKSRL